MRDFGNAYDSIFGFPQGEALLHRLLTGRDRFTAEEASRCPFRIVDLRDLPQHVARFPIDHGQFPTALGAASCLVFHQRLQLLGVVDAHNLPILVCSFAALILAYRLAWRAGGTAAALWAVLLCASHPRYLADSFVNYKDLTVTLFLLLFCLVTLRSLERVRPLETLLACAALGLALASKISIALGAGAVILWAAAEGKTALLYRQHRKLLLPGLALVVALAWLFWPFLLIPPRLVHLAELASRLLAHSSTAHVTGAWREHLLAAHGIRYLLLASPELYLAAAAAGTIYVLADLGAPQLAAARLSLTVAVVYLGFFSLPGVFVTDGLRYVLPAIPCLAIVGGVALARALELAGTRARPLLTGALALALAAWLWVPPLSTHPFEITYFNAWGGGLAAAQAGKLPGASDYWAISYRQVVRWLDRNTERGALLYTPFAPHLIATNDELRPDLQLLRPGVDWCALEPKPVYLFYVTREDLYWTDPIFALAEQHLAPIETFRSQGAPVVKIFREPAARLCELTRDRRAGRP
jgi:4-amino-4-deoxy-L-arabinose transferase-like glycosyltransferase